MLIPSKFVKLKSGEEFSQSKQPFSLNFKVLRFELPNTVYLNSKLLKKD